MDIMVNFQGLQLSQKESAAVIKMLSEKRTLICVYFQIRIAMSFPPKKKKKTEKEVNHKIAFSHADFNYLSPAQ